MLEDFQNNMSSTGSVLYVLQICFVCFVVDLFAPI